MIRHLPNYRRESLRRAMAAGLLSAILLFTAKPVPSATAAQDQVSRDFQQTVTLGAGQSVHIEHKFGSVRLHGESGRDVKILRQVRMRKRNPSRKKSKSKYNRLAREYTSRRFIPKTKRDGFTPARTLRGPSVMTLGCRPTRPLRCETVSAAWR